MKKTCMLGAKKKIRIKVQILFITKLSEKKKREKNGNLHLLNVTLLIFVMIMF